jgi:hypothetical protein
MNASDAPEVKEVRDPSPRCSVDECIDCFDSHVAVLDLASPLLAHASVVVCDARSGLIERRANLTQAPDRTAR